MPKITKHPKCHKCTHHREIPGDAHLRCNNLKAKVERDPVGIRGGWAMHPINFDPVWIESCTGYSTDPKNLKKPTQKLDPLVELFSILR